MKKKKHEHAGQPKKFETPEVLDERISEFFAWCDVEGKPYTLSGLAVFLGSDRRTLLQYKTVYGAKYALSIKKALSKCEAYAEAELFRSSQVAGVIFNLKNNYQWIDKQELNVEAKRAQYTDEEREILRRLALEKAQNEIEGTVIEKSSAIANA